MKRLSDTATLPKPKQINVSIPPNIDERLKKYLVDNEKILNLMGIRNKAQLVSAILENGIVQFDKMVKAAQAAADQ